MTPARPYTTTKTRYVYDAGRLCRVIDRLGRMTSRNDGLDADEVWTYDVRGNRLSLDGRISGSSDLVAG